MLGRERQFCLPLQGSKQSFRLQKQMFMLQVVGKNGYLKGKRKQEGKSILNNLFSVIMEQPTWGFQLQSKREQQNSGRQGTWEKIKHPAMLRDVEHANFFPFPTLSNTGVWKENKSLKGFQSICSLMDRQLWKWHALRLHDHKLQSYICS